MNAPTVAPPIATARLEAFDRVRQASLDLCQHLDAEDMVAQSMPDASPVKWHLAHTTWFFETFVLRALRDYRAFDETFEYLFNSYYETVGSAFTRAQRGLLTRPRLDRVLDYRRAVDDAMKEAIVGGRIDDEAWSIVEVGLHHEQQHQELIVTDVKHLLSHNPLDVGICSSDGGERNRPNSTVVPAPFARLDADLVEIGADAEGFAYDNERPRHRTYLETYEIAERPVTCGEWIEFIEDGGYDRVDLWLSEGWAARCETGWSAPLYWRHDNGRWTSYTLGGRRAVDPNEPVCHVSYFEADAYARWADARLPTEAEWERAAVHIASAGDGDFADTTRLHPRAIGAPGTGAGSWFGGVWEWTSSAYAAYPGFRPLAGALGEYNGKFMCNQYVLRGGSCATPPGHVRATYRNFFPARTRWQFAGLRLARDPSTKGPT